ncbi:FCD domain-containing protein [Polynucleobacter sp.]|jgi:DNA-binding GntR family transcriptional regulator|uniref:FCD domain-containing protein n=1 Tax=Polynucleobacter sp. TaxID=2029855 RepID=UPI0030174A7D
MNRTEEKIGLSVQNSAFELLREHSLSNLVEREIERQIISGELTSGGKLTEAGIANQLRISRGPVREALRSLEQAGLVVNEKNRGMSVRQISLDEVGHIYEVRAALDGLIGRLAAERITKAQLKKLKELIKEMKVAASQNNFVAYFPLNIAFHENLALAAHNPALVMNYRRVTNELTLFRRATFEKNVSNIQISTKNHEQIVKAIESGDVDLSEKLLFDHVMDSKKRLYEALNLNR